LSPYPGLRRLASCQPLVHVTAVRHCVRVVGGVRGVVLVEAAGQPVVGVVGLGGGVCLSG
jgi:hypothetical protein